MNHNLLSMVFIDTAHNS